MKYFVVLSVLAFSSLHVAAESQAVGEVFGSNPVADPFAANSRARLELPLPSPPPGGELPGMPVQKSAPSLPPGLRVMLIRDKGQGLLGSTEAGASSIPVADGKPVRIAGQNYHAEVTRTEVRLYSYPKGELVWEGTLAGVVPVSLQADASQLKYVPPLSAGVSPGLRPIVSSGTAFPGAAAGQPPPVKMPGTP